MSGNYPSPARSKRVARLLLNQANARERLERAIEDDCEEQVNHYVEVIGACDRLLENLEARTRREAQMGNIAAQRHDLWS